MFGNSGEICFPIFHVRGNKEVKGFARRMGQRQPIIVVTYAHLLKKIWSILKYWDHKFGRSKIPNSELQKTAKMQKMPKM